MRPLPIMIAFALLAPSLASSLVPSLAWAEQHKGRDAAKMAQPIGKARPGADRRAPTLAAVAAATPAASGSSEILARIQSVALADLQAASTDAKATGDMVTAPCYDAWIGLIEAQQKAQTNPMPDPHVITGFQRARDLVNALRPGSPLNTACAPLAEELKQDVLDLLGKVAAGAITINTLIPVIP